MIEVEIRSRIGSVEEIKNRLNDLGAEFIKTEKQVDRVFGHSMFLDTDNKIIEGGFSARIRENNNKNSLEFKEILRKSGGIEIKSELGNVDDGLKFLNKIGFEEAFTVAKSRDTYSCSGLIICLDKVDLLGNFIEIEKTIDSADGKEKARGECLDLLKKISPDLEVENRKYGDLMQDIVNKKEND